MSDEEQPLPHDLEAERALLGNVMLHNDVMDEIADVLTPSEFYRHAHACIFEQALRLHAQREPIDFVTLRVALEAARQMDDVGVAYLSSLVDPVPLLRNAAAYAAIVREKAVLRAVIQVARRTMTAAYAAEASAVTVVDQAQQALLNLAVQRRGGFVVLSDVVTQEVMPYLDRMHAERRVVTGVPTGLTDLDDITRGFQPTDLILLGGRPGMGKTALVLGAGFYAATHTRHRVGVFSLEMSRMQLALRALLAEAQIDARRFMTGYSSQNDWGHLQAAINAVTEARLYIDDTSRLTVSEIRARSRRQQVSLGLDLIAVDYLQLMDPTRKGERRDLEVAEISRGLKAIAKDLNVPVIALSQLNRECESRTDKRPVMSDLKESGALEADADLVMFLYRDEVYDPHTPDHGVAEIAITKHRNGPTGKVKVGFEKGQTRFFNLYQERPVGAVSRSNGAHAN